MAPHPLVDQLRFTRAEFLRGVARVPDEDARHRLGSTNCISWNVGHLAWQEQEYFVTLAQGVTPLPEIRRRFASGAAASAPPIAEMLEAWRTIAAAADPWLDALTVDDLVGPVASGRPSSRRAGDLIQRVIYHYWFHNGENQAIRQQLGHRRLPQFVGAIDAKAPYRPEASPGGISPGVVDPGATVRP